MTKKITPNFLRHVLVLIIFSQSLNFFSQSNVYLNVNWASYSGENKMEILNSSKSSVLLSIDHNYGNGSNTSFLNQNSSTVSLPDGTYYVRVYDNYGDDWNGSNPYGKVFVEGVEEFNFDGNFTNNAGAGTEIFLDFSLTINSLDDASFNYSKSSYCQTESDPTPTVTGETGGTFSSTSGLSINSTTGQIDVSTSTLGNYVVTYTTTAPDQNSSTQNVTISDGDVATFSYGTSRVNITDEDLYPTTSGQSGTYSSTSGLSINSSTGVIDISASSVGSYTVTYTTNGSCPKAYTDNVTIINDVFPGVSQYQNSSKKYIEYIPGTMPVIISAPHGGRLQPSELPTRSCGTNEMDDNTDVLIKEIQKKCFDQFGVYPYIIVNRLHRRKLDPNRNESVATCGNSTAKIYFDAFHNFIDAASADITTKFGKGLYIDLHGQSHSVPRVEAGYNLESSSFDEDLNNAATNVTELSRVTIKNLIENNIQNLTFEDLIRGSQSFGGIMQTTGGQRYANLGHAGCSRSVGYRTVPSHISTGISQGSCDDTNPGGYSYFAGDFYNNIRHGSGDTSTANTVVQGGGTVNGGGGTIDGIMTEVNRRVRDLGSVYSSTYGVSDARSATIPYFSRDYAKVIEKFIDLHYNDFSKFSYSANTYSIYGLDPTPSISGISGGTFSSTAGLSISSSTGIIDVSASTQGTYTITYTAPNVGTYYKKEFQLTINAAPVTNEFTASSGNWSVGSNWSLSRIPILQDNVLIPTGKSANLDLENVEINDISVVGTLVINSTKSLTVKGNLSNTGNFSINSGGSLIVEGTSTGNLTYKRNLEANKWYLVGSPFANQGIANFVMNHPNLATGSGSGDNQNIALAIYDNNLASNRWNYYTDGQTDGNNGDDTTDTFEVGKGYSTRVTSNGDISFTGTYNSNDVPRSTIVGAGNAFNLISNPYPSYINSGSFLPNNTGASKGLNNQTLWVWDQSLNGGLGDYITKVTVQGFKIAPGQAFFVEAKNSNGVNFTESMQSHESADTFLRSNRPEIKLKITNGTSVKSTDIFYIEGTTTGFDDGYDGEIFGGVSNTFALYTNLVTDNVGQKLGIQSLPNNNYEGMIVPVGINATAGTEITFTLEAVNIPNQLDIYLEDKDAGIFTKFNQTDSEYTVTLNSDANGIGNFYIHTTSQALSNTSESLNGVNAFIINDDTLRILGIQDNKLKIRLTSVLGKELINKTMSSNGSSDLNLNKIPTGIYFVTIKSSQGILNKKVLIK